MKERIYVITVRGKPFRAHKSLAAAWLECFDQGFVVQRGRHRPGTTAAQRKHRLDYGIHIVQAELPKSDPPKRGRNSKKRKYDPENWIDEL